MICVWAQRLSRWLAVGGVIVAIRCFGASEARSFIAKYCVECHDSETKKGGLDLSSASLELTSSQNFALWVKVCDRVSAGEMPPKKKARPASSDLHAFTNSLARQLLGADRARISREGRATQRRLNRYEYEDTL